MTEGPIKPILHKQIHPAAQFFILIGLLIGLLIVGSGFGIVYISAKYGLNALTDVLQSKMNVPHADTILWILQFTGTTFPILITPIIFSYLVVKEPDDYMKNHFHFPWTLIVIVLLAMVASMPLIEYLGNLNEKMVLPKFLKSIEDWMRESEKETEKLSDRMMQMNTLSDMVYNLLFIGLLTAVVEEILFRGCFQTIFFRWTKNMHAAIWITAILFSAFHMEFYGFLPRLVLGLLFGYFTAWSGSIWPAIWA
ncbi:MAG TPA: CPBP family intramembrane glutamic endopeptidase, partial [Mucilaginibacter sp.]|nr:CPBP family intramembrane glutamic endopeptidase [Mucilaginibacter sp.]